MRHTKKINKKQQCQQQSLNKEVIRQQMQNDPSFMSVNSNKSRCNLSRVSKFHITLLHSIDDIIGHSEEVSPGNQLHWSWPTQPSIPPGLVNEHELRLERPRPAQFISFVDKHVGKKSKQDIAVCKLTSPLQEITYHMGSHSVTCHLAKVTLPPLPQLKMILDLANPKGCKAESI